ncbi:MAG: MBL fold metallo-hydrolase [Pseudomonadota bacterium]|jgi:glyoxylase-like metal-dependent hydrolase (beta-lactamase superfamily II)|nr:MBL fold metallo-hydrolase [Pseudomonadota bacterium]
MPIEAASKVPEIRAFFDHNSNTVSYVVTDPAMKKAAIIDSVLDFDYASGTISYNHADMIIDYVVSENIDVEWLIETHVHADHLSAAPYIQQKLGGKIGISERISEVQTVFGKVFNAGTEFERDGSQFDQLFADVDQYKVGELEAVAIATPGHTPACMVHLIGDAVFVGDTLFMPDGGTARADFPGGDARTLYQSIQKILALPDETRMFVCHDYAPNGREFLWETTVGTQRANNIHVGNNANEDSFVEMREKRDASLAMPRLIIPSIQVNMRAGHMPDAEENGATYLKVPIQGLKG